MSCIPKLTINSAAATLQQKVGIRSSPTPPPPAPRLRPKPNPDDAQPLNQEHKKNYHLTFVWFYAILRQTVKSHYSLPPLPYGNAPTGQLHRNTHCCLGSGHTRKQSNSLALSSISKKVGTRCRSPSYERFLEGCSSPSCDLPTTPRRFALGASNVCLVGEHPTCSVPA